RFFPNLDSTQRTIVHFKEQEGGSGRQNLLSVGTECEYIDVCFGPDWYDTWCDGGCTTSCEYFTHTELSCTIVWTETGGGGPPSGGSQTWWPPTCDVGGVSCGSQGWVPFDPNSVEGYRHFETWDITLTEQAKLNNWRNNNIDTVGLDSCMRQIINKLIGGDNFIGRILTKMDNARPGRNEVERYFV